MEKSVDSHLQIQKGILKYFKNRNGRVPYLNVLTGQCSEAAAKKLGTVKGYYSTSYEQVLHDDYEDEYITIVNNVCKQIQKECSEISIPDTADDIIKRYIVSSAMRSELAYHEFLESSQTAYLYNNQAKHAFIVEAGSWNGNGLIELIKDYKLSILENKTNHPFIVPRNCYYSMKVNGNEVYILPVRPKIALAMLPPDDPNMTKSPNAHGWGIINDNKQIEKMNLQALQYEIVFNSVYVEQNQKADQTDSQQEGGKNKDVRSFVFSSNYSELKNTWKTYKERYRNNRTAQEEDN